MDNLHSHLLTIPLPKDKSHIFWEHAMKTVFAIVGTFALMFFGPMFIAAGSSKTRANDDLALNFVGFFLERPALQFSICFIVAIIYNILVYRKNKKANNIVGIKIHDQTVELEMNNLIFNHPTQITIPLNQLAINIVSKSNDFSGKTKTLGFIDTTNGKSIGCIKADHFIWNKHVKAIRSALVALNKLGVEIKKVSKLSPSIMESVFK
mgnify:CR=1 FL=1|tara:strand:- start:203 stop:826 length:624 start_codon:yes stop_codon:yes gene_type:complete